MLFNMAAIIANHGRYEEAWYISPNFHDPIMKIIFLLISLEDASPYSSKMVAKAISC